jgi:hypothetical protein
MSIKSILSKTLKFALPAMMAGTVALAMPSEAQAQYVSVGVGVYPPAAYIATATPEYYEGRPVYYYGNQWYYRGGDGRWSYYRAEPGYLRERRARWVDHNYYRGGRAYHGNVRYGYRR